MMQFVVVNTKQVCAISVARCPCKSNPLITQALLRRVGMLFLPNDDALAEESKQIVKDVVAKEGRCQIVAWRQVPVDDAVVGPLAKLTQPRVWQVI